MIIWVLCGAISSVFAFLVKRKKNFLINHTLEDLKRLDQDDVKNSEYIEEDVIKSYSFAQRSQLLRSNLIMSHADDDPNIIFKFEGAGNLTTGQNN